MWPWSRNACTSAVARVTAESSLAVLGGAAAGPGGVSAGRRWGAAGGRALAAVQHLGNQQSGAHRLFGPPGEEPPPGLGDGVGVPGVLLVQRLHVAGVLGVEEGMGHGRPESGSGGEPGIRLEGVRPWKIRWDDRCFHRQ